MSRKLQMSPLRCKSLVLREPWSGGGCCAQEENTRREEIDLVSRDGDVLVFVEVKARAAGALVPGYHAVDERKKRVLRRGIKTYLAQLSQKPATFRFDVVEVSLVADPAMKPEILHFENVPLFSKHFQG